MTGQIDMKVVEDYMNIPGVERLPVQLGVNMPAQANQKLVHSDDDPTLESDLFEVYDVVLYLGIIE